MRGTCGTGRGGLVVVLFDHGKDDLEDDDDGDDDLRSMHQSAPPAAPEEKVTNEDDHDDAKAQPAHLSRAACALDGLLRVAEALLNVDRKSVV